MSILLCLQRAFNYIKIETLYNDQHLSYTQIGEILGKHRTTISREIKLGLVELETSYLPVWKYCAEVAQRKNEENETAKGTNLKIGNDIKLANFIEKEIKEEKSSPEVIEYKIKQSEFKTTLCFKTIYNYIDKEIIEVERKDLTCGKYNKKEKIKKEESEYLKPNVSLNFTTPNCLSILSNAFPTLSADLFGIISIISFLVFLSLNTNKYGSFCPFNPSTKSISQCPISSLLFISSGLRRSKKDRKMDK